MTHTTKPALAAVRSWMQQRRVEGSPPPSPERIREMLGWGLIKGEREQRK